MCPLTDDCFMKYKSVSGTTRGENHWKGACRKVPGAEIWIEIVHIPISLIGKML